MPRVRALVVSLVAMAACSHARTTGKDVAPGSAGAAAATTATAAATSKIPIYPDSEVARATSPHTLDGKPLCQTCHARDAALLAEPIALCRRCHSGGHNSHPVDVVQRKPAAGVPLLAGGRVACHSCHDPHAVMLEDRRGLRMEADALCVRCHTGHH
jgi:predicted CXXCH cytochrome family protein